jgi:hypothetical protein
VSARDLRFIHIWDKEDIVTVGGKPTVKGLGIDVSAQTWRRSGAEEGTFEVAFVEALDQRWVLIRVAGDPARRVLVYDQYEWECFIDGAKKGEFDDAAR